MVEMILWLFIFCTCFWVIFQSTKELLEVAKHECPVFSISHFLLLVFVYVNIILGFSGMYLTLEILGYESVSHLSLASKGLERVGNMIYFSTVTTLTIGYGDLTPQGIGKILASLQGLIGYLLPAAFLASGFVQHR